MSNSPPDYSFAVSESQIDTTSPSRHDSSILSQDMPPAAANDSFDSEAVMEKHPKGKRKRTAAKDKMVLEEAYKANPKPDKQARLDIVNRVSLNEKEVQIWFQNRRQNDRRKSRPLSPSELAALRFNGLHGVSTDPMAVASAASNVQVPVTLPAHAPADPLTVSPPQTSSQPIPPTAPLLTATPRASAPANPQLPETTPQNRDIPSSESSQDGPSSVTYSFSGSVGYLANRWNIGSSFSTPAGQTRDADDSPRQVYAIHNAQRQSQTNVRLSLSLEGKAELVDSASSPTRPSPQKYSSEPDFSSRPRGLKRSYSALPAVTLPPISTLTSFLPPRLARGRSRDVQAWQSCADAETRDELTTHAEHESNGSAVAAISLLRSTSGVLQSSNSKRNTPVTTPRDGHFAKKAKFSRTISSVARLEHTGKENDEPFSKNNGKVKVSLLASPTDSDKENWSPDEDGNAADVGSRRPVPPPPASTKPKNPRRVGRSILQSRSPGKLGSRVNTGPSSRPRGMKASVDIFEDEATRVSRDADVEKFMRGDVSPSKKPDMDCVAGLLSLSQGAWR
ncbi:Homeobox protein YOX1 [Beauveria bassiana]|uniref:Homeobox domain-containing protein n=1 Tax=Beauveria bassiana (strain ARSEF 2860) TaxID=655819 RepID=J5K276_BEAB2|nr:homeobox domain-containing protein [Beauveria bassiana ARSEF 2860]EJP70518.1 homeobox domain-containing protein [Beauveria bassiana ARSEF 2860]KAH8717436.1 Homeobox protein YOX1 [Beauveria bassiana]